MKKSILWRLSISALLLTFLIGCNGTSKERFQKKYLGTKESGEISNEQQQTSNKTEQSPLEDEANEKPEVLSEGTLEQAIEEIPEAVIEEIDYNEVKPNEAGKIMVVMFHNFIEEFTGGDREYTTTFNDFENLLKELYEKEYRLVSLSDYINGNINVEAGYKPIVFTFDDGTSGQFNLVEVNGGLKANKLSATGIMEDFYKEHSDFGLEGTFYVNLGLNTFSGEGNLKTRLDYLIERGFEIGNHTFTHVMLSEIKDEAKIQEEIGGNYEKMLELIPDYKMDHFSLPYGLPSSELKQFVYSGVHNGSKYENKSVVEVGWDPAPSPFSVNFDATSVHRVRASGIDPVDMDLAWWLENLSQGEQYVSDGNPNTVAVSSGNESMIDIERIGDRELIVY